MSPTPVINRTEAVRKFFTFGPDQWSEKVPDPRQQYVEVAAPVWADHRALLIGWLGSNRFSSEYTEEEFADYQHKYGYLAPAAIVHLWVVV